MRDIIGAICNGLRTSGTRLLVLAAAASAYVMAFPAHADPAPGTFYSFDAPGGQRDMLPTGINPAGAVTGTYVIGSDPFVFYGFVRTPDGTFTTINVPGSTSTFAGSEQTGWAAGPAINPEGAIAGSFAASGAIHGFVRARDGTFITFDAPGAVNGTDYICCITAAGDVAGLFIDTNFVAHGFLRAPKGRFTAFDPPGSASTVPGSINPAGDISGTYFDANFVSHGFVRARDGTITTFDAPGAVNGTVASGVNPAGAIAGSYTDANFVTHGFLRAPGGTFTTFDAPGSAAPFGTFPAAINPAGVVVGSVFDGTTDHGFLRTPDGAFTTIDPPGSAGTGPMMINPAGVITGEYSDASGANHGFVFVPRSCC